MTDLDSNYKLRKPLPFDVYYILCNPLGYRKGQDFLILGCSDMTIHLNKSSQQALKLELKC